MKGIKEAQISTAEGLALIAVVAIGLSFYLVSSAHHNSPMYETIELNENFDQMDMHEAAIDSIPDNNSQDTATDADMGGTRTDTSTQTGAMDGAAGDTTRARTR